MLPHFGKIIKPPLYKAPSPPNVLGRGRGKRVGFTVGAFVSISYKALWTLMHFIRTPLPLKRMYSTNYIPAQHSGQPCVNHHRECNKKMKSPCLLSNLQVRQLAWQAPVNFSASFARVLEISPSPLKKQRNRRLLRRLHPRHSKNSYCFYSDCYKIS